MASFIKCLFSLFLLALIINETLFVSAQLTENIEDDYDSTQQQQQKRDQQLRQSSGKTSESSYLRELLNAFLNRWTIEKDVLTNQNDYDSNDNDYIDSQLIPSDFSAYKYHRHVQDHENEVDGDESRQMRHMASEDPDKMCEMTHHLVEPTESGYKYMPSFYYEVSCKPANMGKFYEAKNLEKSKKYCFSITGECRNETQEITLFRRRTHNSCWEPSPKKISVGCMCRFPHHNFPSLTYNPPHKRNYL